MPVHALYALTDGARLSGERVRTLGITLVPESTAGTGEDLTGLDRRQLAELANGLRFLLLFMLVTTAAGLTVGGAGSLVERRLPFAVVRAADMQTSELRRIVLRETAAPLLVTTAAGILLGLAASAAMAASTGQPWNGPGPAFLGSSRPSNVLPRR